MSEHVGGRGDRPVALVTGANRGLGFEVAKTLALKGYIVWLGARDFDSSSRTAQSLSEQGCDVVALQLDITDEASIGRAVARVDQEAGRLDALVNNAGIALGGGILPSELDMGAIRSMFETNLFGAIRVTQAFMPALRRSRAGRIVMVSSDIGSHAHQTNPAFPFYDLNPMGYAASKAALNAVTIALSKELSGSPIKVNAANPGFTATDLNQFRGTNTVAEGAAPIVTLATLPDDGPTGTFLGYAGPEPW